MISNLGDFDTQNRSQYALVEDAPETRALKEELLAVIPHCDQIVCESVRLWRQKTHTRLREQMRLQMHFGSWKESVPVTVKDGIPESLFDILVEYRNRSVDLRLRMQREKIRQSATTLDWLTGNPRLIPDEIGPIPANEIETTTAWLNLLDKRIREGSERIIQILVSPDILGAYWYRKKKITIHWMAIGLLAAELNLSVQSLVPIVLFHEFVHAYHHLGFDSDGNQFELEDYAASETDFKEGIAQLYTFMLIDSYKDNGLQMKQAWDQMQSRSSVTYKLRKNWLGKQSDKAGREKEIIRMAMMKTRRQQPFGGVSLKEFEEALETARQELL